MNDEIQMLLCRRAGLSQEEFHRAVDRIVADARVEKLEGEWAALAPAAALSALPHVAETAAAAAPDAIVTLRGDSERLIDALDRDRLSGIANVSASSVLGGHRHPILPGADRVRLFFGLRRLERLSRAEFLAYWFNVHAEFGRRLIPPYTYHQIHANQDLTDRAAQRTGLPAATLDGIVEVHFPSIDALVAQLMRPDVATEALVDERNFIDHARSAFHVYNSV